MKTVLTILFSLVSCILLIAEAGCNESLPAHDPPKNILIGWTVPVNGAEDTVRYFKIDSNNPNLVAVTINSQQNAYDIYVVNTYEETIQDYADVNGKITLRWINKPSIHTELAVSNSSIYEGAYDSETNLLTIDPGDTLKIRAYWNFKFSDETWAFGQLKYVDGQQFFVFSKVFDNFRYHEPLYLSNSARIKIFRSLSDIDVSTKEQFEVNFVGRIRHPE